MNRPDHIHLHIERVILDGVPIERSQSALFVAGLEAELTELFARDEIGAHADVALARVAGPPLRLQPQLDSAAMAAEVGRSVHQTLMMQAWPRDTGQPDNPKWANSCSRLAANASSNGERT